MTAIDIDTEIPTPPRLAEAACEPRELEVHSTRNRLLAPARRSWRLAWVPLASPGFAAVIQEVTGLVAMLEALDIEATYQMTADELLDVALEPLALQPGAPRISARLRKMAGLAGVDPAVLIGWHLAATDSPHPDQPKAQAT